MKTPSFTRAAALTGLCLGLLSSAPVASAVSVTFRVNMEVQATLGNFNAGLGHAVEIHGSFNAWGPGVVLLASGTPNVYEVAIDIAGAVGSAVQYKFVINQAGTQIWEVDGVGPAGAQNRTVNLPAAAEALPVVYFNNQAAPPGIVAVTFQINLSVQQTVGNFNPASHTVEVHGAFDGWGPGISLTLDPNNAGVYQGSVNVNGSTGATFEYKFVINQGGGTLFWEGNVGPGGPNGNRVLTLAASPQILPTTYFNNLTSDPGAGIPVTFRVSLAVQIALGLFNPDSGTVVVAGPFNNWSTSTSTLAKSPEDPTIYTGNVNINTVSPGGSVAYKFVLNGGTWEGGDNRAFTLESPSQILPVEPFDRVATLGPVSISVVTFEAFQVTVSWTGGPRIRLQKSTNLNGPWEEVDGSLGVGSFFFDLSFEEERPPTFFRLIGP